MRDDSIIYAQVLLLDGKIENWKICQDKKRDIYDWKAYWKRDRLNDYTMETRVFKEEEIAIPSGWTFNQYIYGVLGKRWINSWSYADDYKFCKCDKEQTLEEIIEECTLIINR